MMVLFFFFSSRRRHTRLQGDWSSDVCSSDLETERRLRRSRPRWFAEAVYELCYDVVTVRAGGLARTFQELKIRTLRRGWPGLDRLVSAFRDDHDVRPLLIGKRERAEKLHEALESEALARAVQENRAVAVMALEQGQIALRHAGGTLMLPAGSGSGERSEEHTSELQS